MDASPLAALGLGFLLGLTHALDADHLAAVGTLVSEAAGCISLVLGLAIAGEILSGGGLLGQ